MPNTKDDKLDDDVKALKNLGDVLDKLKSRRKEIKLLLAKDLKDEEEEQYATELSELSTTINRLDKQRRDRIQKLGR